MGLPDKSLKAKNTNDFDKLIQGGSTARGDPNTRAASEVKAKEAKQSNKIVQGEDVDELRINTDSLDLDNL